MAASLQRAGFSRSGAVIVVACSGGPDSTALLRSLHRLQTSHHLLLHVAHLNHDFRGAEADHDAAFVQRLADRLGLPCSIDKRDPIAYQRSRGVSSFEQAAREMRYSFLSSVASAVGASAVALGHTSDDQAETVLLHLLRGSGIQGLRGMAEVSNWPWSIHEFGPLLYRPLITVGKPDTAAYCRLLGQTYRQDSGNYLWRFTRNRVRLDLMPRLARDYNPRVRDALVRLSRAAATDADYIEDQLDQYWDAISEQKETAVHLVSEELLNLHPALQQHALRRAYALVAGDGRALGESHLEAMLGLLQPPRGGGRTVDLPREVVAAIEGGVLKFGIRVDTPISQRMLGEHNVRVPEMLGERVEVDIDGWRLQVQVIEASDPGDCSDFSGQRFTAIIRREALGDYVSVRGRRPGDRFQPSGMAGTKKLQDFFTDTKVPRSQRDSIPLLVCDRGIAWVVGHRIADWATPRDDATVVQARFLTES